MSWSDEEAKQIKALKESVQQYCNSVIIKYNTMPGFKKFFYFLLDHSGSMYLTGGCIPSIFHKSRVNDLDIFFRNQESADAVRSYLLLNQSLLENKEETEDYRAFAGISDIALTLKSVEVSGVPVNFQFICPLPDQKVSNGRCVIGDPEDVTKEFDFSHCRAYLQVERDGKFYISPKTFRNIKSKTLSLKEGYRLDNDEDRNLLQKRATKWLVRGYSWDVNSKKRIEASMKFPTMS